MWKDRQQRKAQTTIVHFPGEGHFFSKMFCFTVVQSLVMNRFQLIAGCFGFIFCSWLC